VAVGHQQLVDLGGELGVLDPGIGKRLDDTPVQHRVGGLVNDRVHVEALEVDRVDRAGLHELRDELLIQELVGSSLKRSVG